MAYQQRDNSGSVFRNDRKREGKKDADFAGSGMVNGEEVWIDMWTKPPEGTKKGFFSISFRPKQPRHEQGGTERRQSAPQQHTAPPIAKPKLFAEDPDAGIGPDSPEYEF